MRLTIKKGEITKNIEVNRGENLLAILSGLGYDIGAVCAGKAECFKCKVKIISPKTKPSAKDLKGLTDKELAEGIRLACATLIEEDTVIELESRGEIEVVKEAGSAKKVFDNKDLTAKHLVVDIGTTTVVAALVNKAGETIASVGEKNAQAPYGADVISRIKYVAEGGLSRLNRLIIDQTNNLIRKLGEGESLNEVEDITLVGNTAMLHLFFNRDCSGLGFFPYEGEFLSSQRAMGSDLGLDLNLPVTSLPNISSFAGSDLTAGILDKYGEGDKFSLLIDLGTNAEIGLFNSKKFFAASAAAGPAFEGANIKQGMPALPGAISSFSLINGNIRAETIGNKPAVGICGSGLIDIVANLLENRLLDETGLLATGESFEVADDVFIYAQDIRELQLAKAAIATAVDMLIGAAGLTFDDIEKVYLSGGFGSYINAANAARIGLIPLELSS
ncbi:MAG TPA: ASKHA domain-containing protein, partial [Oscillospiraceae bacterium]|nr:ASKHA domain-containing protein [Oscillospiraceae bacterium]